MHLTAAAGNEFTCFGLCTLPIADPNYSTTKSMWLVRAYNGQRYDRGRTIDPPRSTIRAESVATFRVNVAARTLHYKVNDGSFELAFDNISGDKVGQRAGRAYGCF